MFKVYLITYEPQPLCQMFGFFLSARLAPKPSG